MQTKLTLRLEKSLIEKAKQYAQRVGKPVSRIVADYFLSLDEGDPKGTIEVTPLVRSLRGSLRNVDISEQDYRNHLEDKYL